jgi:hypothetical protein
MKITTTKTKAIQFLILRYININVIKYVWILSRMKINTICSVYYFVCELMWFN